MALRHCKLQEAETLQLATRVPHVQGEDLSIAALPGDGDKRGVFRYQTLSAAIGVSTLHVPLANTSWTCSSRCQHVREALPVGRVQRIPPSGRSHET